MRICMHPTFCVAGQFIVTASKVPQKRAYVICYLWVSYHLKRSWFGHKCCHLQAAVADSLWFIKSKLWKRNLHKTSQIQLCPETLPSKCTLLFLTPPRNFPKTIFFIFSYFFFLSTFFTFSALSKGCSWSLLAFPQKSGLYKHAISCS